ncbi:Fc receptor-like protein 5 [Chanodichthys erythropterus]|uniref:Fc receptor-like protein 5 n=1 Tax=Chanodichthys erythropterus TaxID=933992 RepID=UPI00351ED628
MELSQLPLVLLLISNIYSGHTEGEVQLRVSPQQWLTEGDPVTLICEVKGSSTGWIFSWFTVTETGSRNHYEPLSDSSRGAGGKYTVSSATVNHTGVYVCRAEKTAYKTLYSNKQLLWVTGVSPPVSLIISPNRSQHFTSDSFSLSCEDQSNSDGWTVRRYTDNWPQLEDCSSLWGSQTGSTCKISFTITWDTGVYWCQSESGEKSHPVNITVQHEVQLSVSPQQWLTEGDPVTLICEVKGSSTGWTFSWFTVTETDISDRYKLLSDSSRGAGGNYTVSSATVNHTGVYVCRAQREETAYKTWYSNKQPLWVTGVSPPVSLIISPSRSQHFRSDSLSLSCEDQSNSDRWTVRRYTDSRGRLEDCSSLYRGSQTGSTCTINSTLSSHTGVYWCQSESGEKSHPVNITVQPDVILESPVHPVTEGDTLTLRCLDQFAKPSILRADFYKDESLIQNQTTEMIISTVSKSHEGFYYCKHPEIGESLKSWISVRASGSDGFNPVIIEVTTVIIGVTAGLAVVFLIIVFLVLLRRFRNNKGVRSESPSAVRQQQNISQTSEQNQSEAGYNTPLSGTAHVYDSVDATINKDRSTDGVRAPTEITYAEIELKSTNKQKKKKENKDKNTESCDVLYSKLKLETDQGAGSSDVTYAQVK